MFYRSGSALPCSNFVFGHYACTRLRALCRVGAAAAGEGKEEESCSQPSGLAKTHFTAPTQFTAQITAEGGHEEDACTQASVLSESGLANSHFTTASTQFTTQFPGRRAESRALASGLLLASDLGLENAPFRQQPDTWRRSVAVWQERFQLPLRFVY